MRRPAATPTRSLSLRTYLFFQLGFWGLSLLLRLAAAVAYQYTQGRMLLLEAITHLLAFGGSHAVWWWIERRRLLTGSLGATVLHGLTGTLSVALVVSLVSVPEYRRVYAEDFTQFGTVPVISTWIGVQVTIMVVWFGFILAFAYYDRSRQLDIERAQALAVLRESQLQALKTQVHPHFLFNSFNSLRSLMDVDIERAREAVTNLAAILRYSLSGAQQRLVPLAQELQIVAMYLDLEKLRLADRLQVAATLPPDTTHAAVPPLLLQTLVENAVKFGPAARKQGGLITYEVALTEDRIRITVTNPGRRNERSDSTGTGLTNLQARLRLLYATAAQFELRESDGRVIAEVSLPRTVES